ncbi:MAG: ABC transporter [Candidatus Dormiibacter spiritus]|nr:MAG: ABC transporter [Candidatus Dormibacteraeota bacterium]
MNSVAADLLVECRGLVHIYRSADLEVVALQGLDLAVAVGEMIAIVGRSGSGKTTLLNVLAGLETPSAGTARVAGFDLAQMGDAQRASYQRDVVGYLWQNVAVNLAPELSVLENVQLPQLSGGKSGRRRLERAELLLAMLDLSTRYRSSIAELSAGEQQRLGLAVALANEPQLLLADEPTAQLDSMEASRLLADLQRLQSEFGMTVIIVTHDQQVDEHVERTVLIRDGRTSTETRWFAKDGTRVAEELVLLDRANRLQLPPAYVEEVGLRERVRVRLEEGRVVILPAKEPGSG